MVPDPQVCPVTRVLPVKMVHLEVRDRRVHKDLLETREIKERQEQPEHQEMLVHKDLQVRPEIEGLLESLVLKDLQDHLVHLDRLGHQAQLDRPDQRVQPDKLVRLVLQDKRVRLEHRGLKDRLVMLVLLECQAMLEMLDNKVSRAPKVNRERLAVLAQRVQVGLKVYRVELVLPDQLDLQVTQEPQDRKEHPDSLDLLELEVVLVSVDHLDSQVKQGQQVQLDSLVQRVHRALRV